MGSRKYMEIKNKNVPIKGLYYSNIINIITIYKYKALALWGQENLWR